MVTMEAFAEGGLRVRGGGGLRLLEEVSFSWTWGLRGPHLPRVWRKAWTWAPTMWVRYPRIFGGKAIGSSVSSDNLVMGSPWATPKSLIRGGIWPELKCSGPI